jgi:hypothetical protein
MDDLHLESRRCHLNSQHGFEHGDGTGVHARAKFRRPLDDFDAHLAWATDEVSLL